MVNDQIRISDIIEIIRQGEGESIEFKKTVTVDIGRDIVAFANTEGGVVLIGVKDDGEIVGAPNDAEQRISDILLNIVPSIKVRIHSITIDGKKVVVVKVPKSSKIHTFRNIAYIRVGRNVRPLDIYELLARASEAVLFYSDKMPTEAPVSEISMDYLEWFIKARKEVRGLSSIGDPLELARKLNVVVSSNGKEVLSLAGLLFFHKNPQKYIYWARVRLLRAFDEDITKIVEDRFFEGPVWKIIEDTIEYLRSILAKIPILEGKARREDIYEYPLDAVREAITNALAHRNYLIASEVQIILTPRRLIIRNPGSFPPGVTPENPKHVPRNPLLCQLLFDVGYIEKWGVGIIKMKELCSKHPLVKLRFILNPFYTEVVFEKKGEPEDLLDETDRKILRILADKKEATSSQLSRTIGISKPAIIKRLKKLEALGLIKRVGRGPQTKYMLIQTKEL